MPFAIESTLRALCQQYSDKAIVVAYSGGVDSQVLLFGLAKLKRSQEIVNPILVCHINHGLNSKADQWQTFANQQCEKWHIPFICKHVHLQKKPRQSIEEIARTARYQAILDITPEDAIILTGHHSHDQSETLLLALKRGAGLKGLSAIKHQSLLEEHLLIRPLLDFSRDEILEYANANHLDWVEDDSNTDTQFDRNFLRHEIMPLLRNRWPSIDKTISRSVKHCQESQTLLDELAMQDLENCQQESTKYLAINCLSALSQPRFNNVLRFYLQEKSCLMPSKEQLSQVYLQLAAQVDKSPAVKVGNKWFRRYKNGLFLTDEYQEISHCEITLDLSLVNERNKVNKQQVELPDDLGEVAFIQAVELNNPVEPYVAILAPEKDQTVQIKFRHHNPKCQPEFRSKSRELKKVLQELNIAPWQRKRLPFLYYDNTLIAVLDHFICKPYIPNNNDSKLFINWQKN